MPNGSEVRRSNPQTGFARSVHDYYSHYVDNADAKSGAVLALNVAIGGLALSHLPKETSAHVAAWVGICLEGVSLLAALSSLFPRLPGKGESLIFWEDVHTRPSADRYADEVLRLSDEEVERAYARNNFY